MMLDAALNLPILLLTFYCYFFEYNSIVTFSLATLSLLMIYHHCKISYSFKEMTCSKPISAENFLYGYLVPFINRPNLEYVWRLFTHKFRMYPHFYILGEQKCGTTTLHSHLQSIGFTGCFNWYPLSTLEMKTKDSFYMRGLYGLNFIDLQKYRLCFPLKLEWDLFLKDEDRLVYDGCPSLLSQFQNRDRIYSITPKAKFLIILRDPIERLKSYYCYLLRKQRSRYSLGLDYRVNLDTFEGFIKISERKEMNEIGEKLKNLGVEDRMPKGYQFYDRYASIQRGYYYENIQWWLKKFDKSQFLILDITELNDPNILFKITEFLEARNDKETIEKIKRKSEKVVKMRKNVTNDKSAVECVDAETVQKLQKLYYKENQKLFDFIGRDLGWNDSYQI